MAVYGFTEEEVLLFLSMFEKTPVWRDWRRETVAGVTAALHVQAVGRETPLIFHKASESYYMSTGTPGASFYGSFDELLRDAACGW